MGIKITSLDTSSVLMALFFLIFYQITHFVFNSWDFIRKWRIRATGAKISYITASSYGNPNQDISKDPEQTSLYSWWSQRTYLIKKMEDAIKEIQDYPLKMDVAIQELKNNPLNNSGIINLLHQQNSLLRKLPDNITSAINIVQNHTIDESLKKFDRWFWCYQKEQVFRLIVIEWLFPVIMAIWALYLTFPIYLTCYC